MTAEQAQGLKTTLESMFDNIAAKRSMIEDLQQIEQLHQEIALTAPPMLNHYLQRRSYTKALEFLEQGFVIEETDRPDCDD